MSYISACCGADCDKDIMICSECLEHLGDEDILEDDIVVIWGEPLRKKKMINKIITEEEE